METKMKQVIVGELARPRPNFHDLQPRISQFNNLPGFFYMVHKDTLGQD